MADEDALSRLEIVVEEIADLHGAQVDQTELPDGTWVVSIEHDDWAVTGSALSKAQAYSDLIANAKSVGRA